MKDLTRRGYIRGSMAALAGASAGAALPAMGAAPQTNRNRTGFVLTELIGNPQSADVLKAKQAGVNNVITGGGLQRVRKEQYVETLRKLKDAFAEAGMGIAGVEGHPVRFDHIKLGTPGRDEEIENTKWAIEALSKVGIDMICYNFMPGQGWSRTKSDRKLRGGALTSEFDAEVAEARGVGRAGVVSREKIWENAEYFIKAVMPVADKFKVKMALHPDDPPLSPMQGIGRILVDADAYRRIMDIVPSPMNGITYCQANFKLMGEDIYALAEEWCRANKIFFVHYRDVEGTKEKFYETFHDNGPTDMPRILKIYSDNGFNGPIRPDHAPTMEGEANDRVGYNFTGKVFAFGYMIGIMQSLNLPYS